MADFFLGITLPDDFTEEVESIRRRFAAPKTAPHITLIPPFRWPGTDKELERVICEGLQDCPSFIVTAQGLGRFGRAVIFIDVVTSPELLELYSRLKETLGKKGIASSAKGRSYHPHVTLATRLSTGEFHKYMEELDDYCPVRNLPCNAVALFKMEVQGRFRRWQVVKQIPLG
ncbi:MAG: 2'-5' RNA ligase family protein [Firmicutes bacterium]|nr:2'-5' RNA ligase family protein [Bacillota bacterium]